MTRPMNITVPVGSLLQSAGSDAAIAEYRRLQATAADDYDFDGARFRDAIWGAVEVHRPDVVMPLLELWAALFPKSSDTHEWLGRAYLVSGDLTAAGRNLHTALKLNPESETIPNLLQRIDGG